MSTVSTWVSGLRRVGRAPAALIALWLLTLVVTVPPALALQDAVETHLGASLEADTAADGVNYDWMQEFRAQANPLGRTLRADLIGFGAVLDNASALADVEPRPTVMVTVGTIYVVLLWFFSTGIIQRLSDDQALRTSGFFATCGAFALRVLRLNIVAMVVYAALFSTFHRWLFDDVFENVTRDMTVERTAFVVRLVCYVVFFAVVAAVNLLFDVARVRLVVEDRHSIIAAVASAGQFIRSHTRLMVGLYALNVATLGVVVGLYGVLAPGAGSVGWSMWGGFALSQLYLVARLAVKLAFWASDIAALQAVANQRVHPAPLA